MRFMYRFLFVPLVLTLMLLTGCSDDPVSGLEELPGDEALEVQLVEDVPADPITGVNEQGRPVGNDEFTFFSLRENAIVAREDSASTQWDIAFRSTSIIVNGGISGPGEGAALVLEETFHEVNEAPAAADFRVDSDEGNAVPTGSGNGWYNYNPQTNLVTPIPGRTIAVRTADGRVAKLRIQSYYKGAPSEDELNAQEDEARYYTFEFAFQDDPESSSLRTVVQ
jgi:hypothetical protein